MLKTQTMETPARYDVVCLGYAAVDYLALVPRIPEVDTKMEMLEFSIQGGGPAATAAAAAARLGAKTAFVGAVGGGDPGRFVLDELAREGVDVSGAVVFPEADPRFSLVLVDKSSGKRTIIWTRSNLPPLEPSALDRKMIESCRVLHVDRHEVRAVQAAAAWVKEEGGIVSMDAGTYVPEVETLLPMVDVLIASHAFARDAVNEEDPQRCAYLLLQDRLIAGVTCGEHGSYFATRDGGFHVPSFKVEVVDTTGAGDVFHGAFAFGLAQGWDAHRCAVFASAVAALKCRRLGGRAGIPTRKETEDLLSRQ